MVQAVGRGRRTERLRLLAGSSIVLFPVRSGVSSTVRPILWVPWRGMVGLLGDGLSAAGESSTHGRTAVVETIRRVLGRKSWTRRGVVSTIREQKERLLGSRVRIRALVDHRSVGAVVMAGVGRCWWW